MELNKLYTMDCLDGLRQLEDNSIDLTVTSPPYDTVRNYVNGDFLKIGDCKAIAQELYRVTKEGGTVVWVVADGVKDGDESGTSFFQALLFKEIGFKLKDTMIYIKNGGINAGSLDTYQQKFEYMFVFTKGKQKTHNLIKDRPNKYVEDRITKKRQKDGTYKEQHFKASEYGVRYNYWIYDTGSGKSTKDKIAFEHPAIFPEKLAEDHIISWSNEGDVILDIFSGSGTTCKMAKKNNRQYIGFDLNERYCEIAEQRIRDMVL